MGWLVLVWLCLETSFRSYSSSEVFPEFNRSIYWLVHNRRKYGFRHLCMLILVLVYTLLGAAMFFTIEAKHEHHLVTERKAALDKSVLIIAGQLIYCSPEALTIMKFQSTYISLLKDESLYEGSTYWKASDAENFKWTYASAFFFSMNLYTTTGYGSIAAESMLGRICVMWYSMLTIPITLVVIRDLGQATLVCITKVYTLKVVFRRTMGYLEPHEDSMISLPIKFCLMLLAGYLLFAAAFIYLFDDWMGYIPHSGLSFFTSLYFSYISISTIGLGDIMPNNATFHPIISILFFFGMPVMKVVNRATYICIENGVFGKLFSVLSTLLLLICSIREDKATELLNGLTIRSLAAFARTNADVYGGGFGRVNLRKGDLVQSKTSVGQNPEPSP
ncbi:unnamed protein product [Haemonchus placei]|uniref:Potassium channel domain-containing protein n=1 Tax=Haemonchus placei TaxID=6290 RepID=A0A3P7Y817_HAEPC|nr:unnamed protein product [Haemonchus placei]